MEQSLINITPLNPNLSECHVKVLYHGLNRNGSYISKAVAEKLANKLPGTPIVGLFSEEKQDFEDHGERVVINNGTPQLKRVTKSFGFVKQDTKVWWQSFEENGEKRDYMMCEGYLWTEAFPEVKRVIEKGNWQSMEFMPQSLKGEWAEMNHEKGKNSLFFVVEDASFRALCILGEDVEPCFETAAIGAPGTLFTKDNDLSDFEQIKDNIENSLKGGQTQMPEENQVLAPETTEETVEVPAIEEEVAVETVVETEFEAEAEIETPVVEEEDATVIEETQTESVVEEPAQTELVVEEPTEDNTIEELRAELTSTTEQLKAMTESYNKIMDELKSLHQLKNDIESKEKDAIIAAFYMLDEADIAPIREQKDSLSKEDIEKELAVIAFRQKVNFSILEEKEETVEKETTEEEPIVAFNMNVEDTTPAWVRAVENNRKNRI